MNAQQFQPLILTVGFLAIFYFLVIRPQKKKEAQINEMRNNLRVGDEVITIGGICGKIIKAKEDYITLEVGSAKTKLEMTRWAIGSVVKKNESKSKKDESPID
ncbi:MAG: preprotein translocase subunit YajC, partial [Tissierellia bacterium]|nr:preprotein translocase subunit YajC [Tissierellia bacterium]